jgi:multicomponent K+:H+ antiporter subunit F
MLTLALTVAEAMLGAAFVLNLWRLWRGPDAVDRVLALDTLYINTVALLLVYEIRLGIGLFYEAALLIALLGFIGTVALAEFLLRGEVIE